MLKWVKENSIAFAIAAILHMLLFGLLFFHWPTDEPQKIVLQQGDVIQVTSVDASTYETEVKKIDQQKQAEKKQQQEIQRRAEEQKKKKRLEEQRQQQEKKRLEETKRKQVAADQKKKAALKKAEQEKKRKAVAKKEADKKAAQAKRKKEELKRQEEEERKLAARKKLEQEKAEREKAEREQVARKKLEQEKIQQEKKRLAEEKKRQQAEQKRKAEEATRQAELQLKERQDRAARELRSKGIVKRHIALITQKIERNWRQPLDSPSRLQCKIDIVLLPSGNVLSVKVYESSGNASFDRSVETAVRKASPLPVPSDSVIFKQFELMRLRFEPGNN